MRTSSVGAGEVFALVLSDSDRATMKLRLLASAALGLLKLVVWVEAAGGSSGEAVREVDSRGTS